jgi:eukaryotic-like serine/threonine-protein kinase
MRVLAGVGAWLLGVAAATGGSLLAVSLLGQGIATSPSQQLTVAAVNRALAAEAGDTPAATPATTGAPSPAPSATRSYQAQVAQTVRPQAGTTPSARASRSRPAASPSAQATATAGPTSTVLTSVGGTVVADCRPDGAYLVSWSPAPGYEVGTAVRGPAVTARLSFNSTANSVTMLVSCSAGIPTATSTVGSSGTGGDDGGPGGDD